MIANRYSGVSQLISEGFYGDSSGRVTVNACGNTQSVMKNNSSRDGCPVSIAGALLTGQAGCLPAAGAGRMVIGCSCGQDLDAVDLGVVLDGDELDGDGPGAGRGGGERLDDRDVLSAGGGEDVEVGQYLGAVDQDVEGP